MNPPFDPPYVTTYETEEGVRRIETLAAGATREVSELSVSSKIKALRASTYMATTAKVPKQLDNNKATVFLKVSFAEKEEAKKLERSGMLQGSSGMSQWVRALICLQSDSPIR